MAMNRRQFLRVSGTSAGAASLTSGLPGASADASFGPHALAQPDLLSILGPEVVREIGLGYRVMVPAGTTRMHDDPRQGVVDANCRVHGLRNLYVAGASAFPTGGAANPTLTLVALSLRVSDHLKTRLA
jgi:choline dehydrogenase-like flavoprotein